MTLLFANFAEAIAEARGKAQADSLRKTREETPAKIVNDKQEIVNGGEQLTIHNLPFTIIASSQLKR